MKVLSQFECVFRRFWERYSFEDLYKLWLLQLSVKQGVLGFEILFVTTALQCHALHDITYSKIRRGWKDSSSLSYSSLLHTENRALHFCFPPFSSQFLHKTDTEYNPISCKGLPSTVKQPMWISALITACVDDSQCEARGFVRASFEKELSSCVILMRALRVKHAGALGSLLI